MIRQLLFAAAAATVLSSAVFVSGQAPAPPGSRARTYVPPRTVDGRADLSGSWTFSTLTPLERPADLAGKPTLTLEEAAQWEKATMERTNADRRDGTPAADLARAYNNAWWDRGTHMAIIDGVARTSLIVDPPDGRIPALTPEAQRRVAARAQHRVEHPADGPEDRSLAERCLSFNAGPPMLPGGYNNYMQVFQFKDHVVIFNEMIHDARIVPTDGRAHLPQSMRKFLGDSIGKWEGNTLVVDTTNFTDRTNFRGASDRLHLVEKFTRTDANTLLYEFTVDDPSAFTRPWSAAVPMRRTDDQLYEYACHEANHGMIGILSGERFAEKNVPR